MRKRRWIEEGSLVRKLLEIIDILAFWTWSIADEVGKYGRLQMKFQTNIKYGM